MFYLLSHLLGPGLLLLWTACRILNAWVLAGHHDCHVKSTVSPLWSSQDQCANKAILYKGKQGKSEQGAVLELGGGL